MLRVDTLSLVFGYVFVIMSFAAFLYALHIKGIGEHLAALAYPYLADVIAGLTDNEYFRKIQGSGHWEVFYI